MTGKSHFIFGCAVAASVAYLGMQNNDASSVAMALTIPFGAKLPDIDHDKTDLGQKRHAIIKTVKICFIVVSLLYAINMLYLIIFKKQDPVSTIIGSLISVGPIIFGVLIATNPVFKKKTKFFRKHRGIMHTLFPIFGLMFGAYMLKGGFISMLLTGISIGYATHLIADQETKMGNPILWPLTTKNIPGLPIRAGSSLEYVVLLIDCGVVFCLTMFLSRH